MKKLLWPIVVGLLSIIILIEATTDFDILDKDKEIFCEEIVMDTVLNTVVVPGKNITHVVEYEKMDTVIMNHYQTDTIREQFIKNIRDTVYKYVDAGAEFRADTLEFENASLEYFILTTGELVLFHPTVKVSCPKVELNRWSVGLGMGYPLQPLGSVKYRFNSKWDAQVIGSSEFVGFLSNYSF